MGICGCSKPIAAGEDPGAPRAQAATSSKREEAWKHLPARSPSGSPSEAQELRHEIDDLRRRAAECDVRAEWYTTEAVRLREEAVAATERLHQVQTVFGSFSELSELYAPTLDPRAQKVVLFDPEKIHKYAVNGKLDLDLNRNLWLQLGKAMLTGQQLDGILVCSPDEIPAARSAFITHRWTLKGGFYNMPLALLRKYMRDCILGVGVKGGQLNAVTSVEVPNSEEPLWIWLDQICAPQRYHPPFTSAEEEAQERKDAAFNAAYIGWVGLKFGEIASRCHTFFYHMPVAFKLGHEKLSKVLVDTYSDLGADLASWVAVSDEDAARGWKLWRIGKDCFGALYENDEYPQRIWCMAEYLLRMLNRGSEAIGMSRENWWSPLLAQAYDEGTAMVLSFSVVGTQALQHRVILTGQHTNWADGAQTSAPVFSMPEERQAVVKALLRPKGFLDLLADVQATVPDDIPLVLASLLNQLAAVLGMEALPAGITNMVSWFVASGTQYEALHSEAAAGLELYGSKLSDITPADLQQLLPPYVQDVSKLICLDGTDLAIFDRLLIYTGYQPPAVDAPELQSHSFGRTALELLWHAGIDGTSCFTPIAWDGGLEACGHGPTPELVYNRDDQHVRDVSVMYAVRSRAERVVYPIAGLDFTEPDEHGHGALHIKLGRGYLAEKASYAELKHHDARHPDTGAVVQQFKYV
jgi:hypothetical protein